MNETITVPRSLLRHHPNHVATYAAIKARADAGDDSPRASDLADLIGGLTESSISRRLWEMERAGLIRRHAWERGEGSRRGVRFELRDPAAATPKRPASPTSGRRPVTA